MKTAVRWPKWGLGRRVGVFLEDKGVVADALLPLLVAMAVLAVVMRLLGYLPEPTIWVRVW